MEALLQATAKDAMTDAAMRKVYDDAVTQLPREEEVHARHILFRATAGDEKARRKPKPRPRPWSRASTRARISPNLPTN